MSKTKKPKLFIKRALLDIKSPDYQPTQEELNEEFDISGVEQMCSVVFKPFVLPKSRRNSKK